MYTKPGFQQLQAFPFSAGVAAMEVVFLMSGERLAVLHPDTCKGKSAAAVKKSLATDAGVSRFRQRLFVEDGSREIQDDETFDTSPAKVQLVILEFCPPDAEQRQQMFAACANNDSVALGKLLQHPLQPNVTDRRGRTPLHQAVWQGHVESMQLLIEADANLDQSDTDGATPMFLAAQHGHVDVVRYLAEAGAHIDKGDTDGATPLWIAAQYGHVDVVRCLAEAGAHIDKVDNGGTTPLRIAAQDGHVDVVRYLEKAGARKDKGQWPWWHYPLSCWSRCPQRSGQLQWCNTNEYCSLQRPGWSCPLSDWSSC